MRSATTIVVLAAALAVAAAGCGKQVFDPELVEGVIRATSDLKVAIAAADCPPDVEAEDGATFKCEVRYENGSEEAWTMEQLNAEGTVRVVQVVQTKLADDGSDTHIIPANVEALVQKNATKPLEDVDCPEGIEIESGASFECVARFRDGSKSAVTILELDDLGNVEVSSARPVK